MGRKRRDIDTKAIAKGYLLEGLSSHALARRHGLYHGQVLVALEKENVKRRSRSEALRLRACLKNFQKIKDI